MSASTRGALSPVTETVAVRDRHDTLGSEYDASHSLFDSSFSPGVRPPHKRICQSSSLCRLSLRSSLCKTVDLERCKKRHLVSGGESGHEQEVNVENKEAECSIDPDDSVQEECSDSEMDTEPELSDIQEESSDGSEEEVSEDEDYTEDSGNSSDANDSDEPTKGVTDCTRYTLASEDTMPHSQESSVSNSVTTETQQRKSGADSAYRSSIQEQNSSVYFTGVTTPEDGSPKHRHQTKLREELEDTCRSIRVGVCPLSFMVTVLDVTIDGTNNFFFSDMYIGIIE